jgi:hypothetical protein
MARRTVTANPHNDLLSEKAVTRVVADKRVKRILDGEDDDEHEGRLLNF